MRNEMTENKSEWLCMQITSAEFKKWDSMHVCEASRRNGDRPCKNSVMRTTIVRCEQKLKRCLYKITYIKMTTSAHSIQADKTHTKRNTKSHRNAARDMKNGLTPKQLSWMCWWLLDAMWDVKDTRSMWGMSSVASGWFCFDKVEVMTCMAQI